MIVHARVLPYRSGFLARIFHLLLLGATAVAGSSAGALAQPAVEGSWAGPYSWPRVPSYQFEIGHAAILPVKTEQSVFEDYRGHVLLWRLEGSGCPANTVKMYLFDPSDPTSLSTAPDQNEEHNVFCAGAAFMPDGRLLAGGGMALKDCGDVVSWPNYAHIFDSAKPVAMPTVPYNPWSDSSLLLSAQLD